MIDTYHLPRKNATFHIVILHRHLWGGRFQMSVIGERQVAGGNGRNPQTEKSLVSVWKVFGSVISS